MPKKSKKSKSKRMSLKQKHKIIKKVKEHHKKVAKQAKKTGTRKAAPKDPGIPNQWPFKAELLKELAWEKQRILDEEKRKKEDRRQAQSAAARGLPAPDVDADMTAVPDMTGIQQAAIQKQQAFDATKRTKRSLEAATATDQDGSRKAFYKEFMKVVDASDVVIEVLDARDPLGCRCTDVERLVRRSGQDKKVILLLNKMDLVPREVAEQWLKYLREELPTVAFKCSTQKQATNLGRKSLPKATKAAKASGSADGALQGSECLGAESLLQLLKNYARNANLKTAITVGVVGLPNVGKSSLINSLKRMRVAQVGNTPGVTKAVQEIVLDKQLRLLDSPGIVFAHNDASKAANALRNCVKVEKLEEPVLPVTEIVARCPAKQLMSIYKVPAFEGADQLLQHIALARGKLKKGGTVDVESAARIVLQDWNDGRIPYYTLPPKRESQEGHAAAEVVSSWAADFNADRVFADEQSAVIAGLPSLEEAGHFHMQSAGPCDVRLDAVDEDTTGAGAQSEDLQAAPMEQDENETPVQKLPKGVSQADQLYDEEGQFNPHSARAAKKRSKKQKQHASDDDTYDFGEAFADEPSIEMVEDELDEDSEAADSDDELLDTDVAANADGTASESD